jgi:hypothetical protein
MKTNNALTIIRPQAIAKCQALNIIRSGESRAMLICGNMGRRIEKIQAISNNGGGRYAGREFH